LKKIFTIHPDYKDSRIDRWLKKNFSTLNQSFIEKNLRKGYIKVNDHKIASNYRLNLDDRISIFNFSNDIYKNIPKNLDDKIISNEILKIFNASIIFENNNFIILNKWSGIATQGGSKINISIDNIIKNISLNYNLVHRLDRETSGLLIISKNLIYTRILAKLFKENQITKIYIGICQGHPLESESEVKISILKKNNMNKSSEAITRYKVLQTQNNLSNIIFNPLTGKTHQIRIVSEHLGCPIVGDTKYNNNNKYPFEKLKLNAHLLKFTINNKTYEFSSKLPGHFLNFFKKNNLTIPSVDNIDNFLKII